MKFPGLNRQAAGVAVPVTALRGPTSFGTGEFSDLPLLGAWCRDCGLDVLQILPVNDTGYQSSPYGALSAFALHPLYLRLEELPELSSSGKGGAALKKEIMEARAEFEKAAGVKFFTVLKAKEEFLRRIFTLRKKTILSDEGLFRWIDANPWAPAYCLFRSMKEKNAGASWTSWADPVYPGDEAARNLLVEKKSEDLLFFAWVQMRLEEQFVAAAKKLDEFGVFLKGDLPILMSEDSADVWSRPRFFLRGLRAGAPPDMFSHTGQNWDFPIYDWDALEKDDYSWWKERLKRADLFYHLYRIDHVLGFFRIWAIPEKESSGVLGHFHPSAYLKREDLEKAGFDKGRIRWLTLPHVPGPDIRNNLGKDAEKISDSVFQRLGEEDLFLFRPEVGEKSIENLDLDEEKKRFLLHWYRDRGILEVGENLYRPAWYRDSSLSFGSLNDDERRKIGDLVAAYFRKSEAGWEKTGRALLRFMKDTSSMLPCAEDLGVVPDCVPRVLESLGILGLRVPRWTRRYKEAGEPYVPLIKYPAATVCSASVHDTSTLREWWETEADRPAFWQALGLTAPAPEAYDAATAEKVVSKILETGSALAMFQLQDFLALEPRYRVANSAEERVNVPGTVNEENWSYRLPFPLEELVKNSALTKKITALVMKRRAKPAAGVLSATKSGGS